MPNEYQPLVYFFAKSNFGDGQPDFIKVGHTRKDLSLRQASLQTGSESPIWEIGVIPFETVDEAVREEKRIHEQFGGFRAHGEWFYATYRIIQFIENHAVQHTEVCTEDVSPESKDVLATSFGEQLRRHRDDHDMSQDELATKVGCTRGYISFLENNRGTPGQSIYTKLVELFGEFLEPISEARLNNLLAVRMENEHWISKDTAIDTFIEAIKALGIEEVKNLDMHVNGIPLIANRKHPKDQRKVETETRTYYIVSGTNTVTKKRILDDIAVWLERDITVFANPRITTGIQQEVETNQLKIDMTP